MPTFSNVATAAELQADITAIDSSSTGNGTQFVIELQPGATLTQSTDMPAIDLKGSDTLVIDGGAGAGTKFEGVVHRAFFVYQGHVTIANLTIDGSGAEGTSGTGGGGGGAGLGGGLFVANDAADGAAPSVVTLEDVSFGFNVAIGGIASSVNNTEGAGGSLDGGGLPGFPSFGSGGTQPQGGFAFFPAGFGGGGAGGTFGFMGVSGLAGGFGGGGGGGGTAGEFGSGNGGFGAGSGSTSAGGGGLGAGGQIFVQSGATLVLAGGTMMDGVAEGGDGFTGSGAVNGMGYGNGIFLQGGTQAAPTTVAFGTGQTAGQVTTVQGQISDESGASGTSAGVGAVEIQGHGTVVLADTSEANNYTGGTRLDSGTLELAAAGAQSNGGNGAELFEGVATLQIDAAAMPPAGIFGLDNFHDGDVLDLRGMAFAGNTQVPFTMGIFPGVTVQEGTAQLSIILNSTDTHYVALNDGHNGTAVVQAGQFISDFDTHAFDDVMLQVGPTSQLVFANMESGANAGYGALTSALPGLTVVGHGDINGDGIADVVVQDPNTDMVLAAQQTGAGNGQPNWVALSSNLKGGGADFHAVGVGDINGDGHADVLIQNEGATGDGSILAITAPGAFASVAPALKGGGVDLAVVGVGDINDDGFADIVLQDQANASGQVLVRDVHDNSFVTLATNTGGLKVAGVGDITGDGHADVILQAAGGGPIVYLDPTLGLNGFQSAIAAANTGLIVKGVADVDGDGIAEILLQSSVTHEVDYFHLTSPGSGTFGAVVGANADVFHLV